MPRFVATIVLVGVLCSVCSCTSATSSKMDNQPASGNRIPPGAGKTKGNTVQEKN